MVSEVGCKLGGLIIKALKSLIRKMITFFIKVDKSPEKAVALIEKIILTLCSKADAQQSLKFLLTLEKELYTFTGQESCRYNNGIHTKHKHTGYHNFFIKHINNGESALDIGCGNGTLAFDIAKNVPNVKIYGIDIVDRNIEYAREHYQHKNLKFVIGDALKDLPDEKFDCVILSNVLEHIENRIKFLARIKKDICPQRTLIRVPLYERDWRVPLMDELGLDYRLDSTHFVEYIYEDFVNEINAAGFEIVSSEFRWGEVWSVCSIKK